MSLSLEELIEIRDLPSFLRSEHCYNDMQHAMLVILFRHALTALHNGDLKFADNMMDNLTLYFYIHFLNEEEGLAYKLTEGLLEHDRLAEHSELHIKFLDHWRDNIFAPYKREQRDVRDTIEELAQFYNLIIKHIDQDDLDVYGARTITVEETRTELARVAQTRMPMSPYMPGAFQTVQILDREVADLIDPKCVCPVALEPMQELNLIQNVGRVLSGSNGSYRDRFAIKTQGDRGDSSQLMHAVPSPAIVQAFDTEPYSAAQPTAA